jgi:predicted DNA-binding transcriptional regulator AlpA
VAAASQGRVLLFEQAIGLVNRWLRVAWSRANCPRPFLLVTSLHGGSASVIITREAAATDVPAERPVAVFYLEDRMSALRASAASRLVCVEDVATLLSASPRTVRRLDAAGKLPRGIKLGGLKRWREDELLAWIAAGCPDRLQWSWKPATI